MKKKKRKPLTAIEWSLFRVLEETILTNEEQQLTAKEWRRRKIEEFKARSGM